MKTGRTTSFREAVALNNIGTGLLNRMLYEEAAEAFKGAIAIMKSTVASDSTESRSTGAAEKLHNARKMLTTVTMKKRTLSKRFEVDVLSNDSLSMLKSGVSERLEDKVSAIQIENYTSGSGDANINAAILFYNYGVASYLLSRNTRDHLKPTSGSKRVAYLKAATRLFRMSHSICSKAVEQKDEGSSDRFQALHVMGIVLGALTGCLQQRSPCEAEPYAIMLLNVKKVLNNTHHVLLSDCPAASAAA